MYPNPLKLEHAKDVSVTIDECHVEGNASITVGHEPYAGTGHLEITVEVGRRKVQVMMSPNDALVLADAMQLYANRAKRVPVPNIVMRENNGRVKRARCTLCETPCRAENPDFFLAGTWDPVCEYCAERWAPELVIQLELSIPF